MPEPELNGLRVLLFSHETTLSGAPLALSYLASALTDAGAAVQMAAPEEGPISELLIQRGVEVVHNPNFLSGAPKGDLEALCAAADIVIANTLVSWPVVRAAHQAEVPVIWYLHETMFAVELMRQVWEARMTLDLADLLVTPTARTAALYEGISRTRTEVIPYGIPVPEVTPASRTSDALQFLTLGTYERRKGQDVLLDAIGQLPPDLRRNTYFRFAGRRLDSGFYERLEAQAARLENVELGPALDRARSMEWLAQADVLVCSSRDETMPISIIEAFSLGKVVISTDVGGIGEWLRDGMNGQLVPSEDPEALRDALERCALNPRLRATCGANAGRTYLRHFTLKRFAEHFLATISRVVTDHDQLRRREAPNYTEWVAAYDTLNSAKRTALRRRVRSLFRHPRISILLPVYNPDLELLEKAIESVRRQLYSNWELCIADDASTDPAVRPFLERTAQRDARIKLVVRKINGHISAASNSALTLATGEWCALLDQDDELTEHALALVACEIIAHPEARLIYSDEDKIDTAGARSSPFFKPDWNPELFHGQNFINHLGVYETALLREIGGFREGYEGSQDYDLALRCVDRIKSSQVRHVPRVLYHWRAAPGSLAELPDAKPYAREAARRALHDHLIRAKKSGRVEPCPENNESHRIIYDLPEPLPLVSVIIATRDRLPLLRRCLETLRRQTDYAPIELVIVDNNSVEQETLDYLGELQRTGAAIVVRDEQKFNFSRLNNLGAARASGEILAFLNNDIEITDAGWLREMVSHAAQTEVGVVGARLWYGNGSLQHGGVVLGLGGVAGHAYHRIPRGHPGYFNGAWLQRNCSAVTAACMLTRRSVFEALNGFDESNLGINFNDVDYCLRVRARGLQVVWTPYSDLIHHESASRGHHEDPAEQAQFRREADFMQARYAEALLRDPCYNPNLTLVLPGYLLAFPPRVPQLAQATEMHSR